MTEQAWPSEHPRSGLPPEDADGCGQRAAHLAVFITRVLAGTFEGDAALGHMESCTSCSQTYIDLIDLHTAPQLQALEEALLDPSRAPAGLDGLLRLWEGQLAAARRLSDLRGTAAGMSVIGMIHRQLGQKDQALLIHRKALETAKEADDVLSQILGYTDLGELTRSDGRIYQAIELLEAADRLARQVSDEERGARIQILLGRGWEVKDLVKAEGAYMEAQRLAVAASYDFGISIARVGLEAVSGPAETEGIVQRATSALTRLFYQACFQPAFAFSGAGERILVVNTASEVRVETVAGPEIDPEGNLIVTVTMDGIALADLPAEFFIDLLFVPSNEVVSTVFVGEQERLNLQSVGGLKIGGRLPAFGELLPPLHALLEQHGVECWRLPKTAIALRVRWDA